MESRDRQLIAYALAAAIGRVGDAMRLIAELPASGERFAPYNETELLFRELIDLREEVNAGRVEIVRRPEDER